MKKIINQAFVIDNSGTTPITYESNKVVTVVKQPQKPCIYCPVICKIRCCCCNCLRCRVEKFLSRFCNF